MLISFVSKNAEFTRDKGGCFVYADFFGFGPAKSLRYGRSDDRCNRKSSHALESLVTAVFMCWDRNCVPFVVYCCSFHDVRRDGVYLHPYSASSTYPCRLDSSQGCRH